MIIFILVVRNDYELQKQKLDNVKEKHSSKNDLNEGIILKS